MLVGSFLLSVFFFPFPVILHFMCIYCVISIHIRYFPVYVWLLVMYHWLSVPNNGKSALFALRPVNACTSHVQEPQYLLLMSLLLCDCHWDRLFDSLEPLEKSKSYSSIEKEFSYFLSHKSGKKEKKCFGINPVQSFKNSQQSFANYSLCQSDLMLVELFLVKLIEMPPNFKISLDWACSLKCVWKLIEIQMQL